MVNAKLRMFNKPFLLAMLIGVFQIGVLVPVFLILSNVCERKSILAVDARSLMFQMAKLTTNYCIIEASTLQSSDKEGAPCFLNEDANFCNDDVVTMNSQWGQVGAKKWNADMVAMKENVIRCPFTLNQKCYDMVTQKKSGYNRFTDPEGGWNDLKEAGCYIEASCHQTDSPYCSYVPYTAGGFGQNVWYNECPGLFVTLGVTLGYAGLIEFGLTVFIVVILWQCGVVNTKDSSMKQWMKDIIKENAGAVVAETQSQLEANDVSVA